MKRQVKRIALMTMGMSLSLCSMSTKQLSASPLSQVSVNINIGAPPPVIVQARPTMVYLQEPAAYVAVGIPYDIFFIGGRYYYLHGNDWFWGAGYNGPWLFVEHNSLPPGLRKYKVEKLHEFREREYRVYKVQGPGFRGQHFEAEERKDDHKEDSKPGRGNSDHGRGNGKK